jgi:subtilisin family serine protease
LTAAAAELEMNRTLSWLAAAAAFGATLSSCCTIRSNCGGGAPCGGPQGPALGPHNQPAPAQDLYAVLPQQTPTPFFVALGTADGRCADLPGGQGEWRGRELFTVPGKTFCAYVWQSEPLARPDIQAFGRAQLQASMDAPSLAFQASPISGSSAQDAWFESLFQRARARAGMPATDDSTRQGRVRVAVIDSASGDFYREWSDPVGHGRAVGRVIDEVACSGHNPCRVQIVNYPALTLDTSADMTLQASGINAGAYGTRAALAEQIEKASSDWLNDRARGAGPQHLVINLSVGWSGCWEDPKGPDLASQAVRAAMTRAVCRGALIVAAAGNRDAVPGCPIDSPRYGEQGERVYPALFGRDQKPIGEAECKAAGIALAGADAAATLGPLVLSASAVDEYDEQLGVAEQASTLEADGNAVVMRDGNGWTQQFSGTSMSAATVSGIAAAVWSAYPKRTTAELERDLVEPAVLLLERRSDDKFICNPQRPALSPHECESVRRASLCRSLIHAGGGKSDCGPAAREITPIDLSYTSDPTAVATDGFDCSVCAANPNQPGCETCAAPPPTMIDAVEQPWAVGPQPGGDACGTCVLNHGTNRFEAGFKSTWQQYMYDLSFKPAGLAKIVLKSGKVGTASLTVSIGSTAAHVSSGTLYYTIIAPSGTKTAYTESLVFSSSGTGTH